MNEVERCRAAICFLSLIGLYLDFCAIRWDEDRDLDYLEWGHLLGITPFRIGQLIGATRDWLEIDQEDEFLRGPLKHLADKAREEILPILMTGFNGESGLYYSLCAIRLLCSDWSLQDALEAGAQEEKAATEYLDSLNTEELVQVFTLGAESERIRAHDWILQGCPPHLPLWK